MQFLYQPLTWGFLLVLLPLAIHLINLMRQRRIKWAAMDFLLQAYRKHRKWIWLRQFLLLISRMIAIAAVVAMLAHLVTRDQWTRIFGGKTTHHIVLLDDSFSMSDQSGSASAFDRAGVVLTRLADRAMAADSIQKFTLLRFSRAHRTVPENGDPVNSDSIHGEIVAGVFGEVADLNAVGVDADFDVLLEEKRRAFSVSQLAVGPAEALNLTAQLVAAARGERAIVYLVSDFREGQWAAPTEAMAAVAKLEEAGARVNFVQCVDAKSDNLAITEMAPAPGTQAAGVPLFVDVTVRNFGDQEALQVPVTIQSIYFAHDSTVDDPAKSTGQVNDLPNLLIDRIAPGDAVTRRVQVYFATAGQHAVRAELPADSVLADNRRWCVVDFPDGIPILVVDGDPQRRNAVFLESVFQPGERVNTGIHPTIQTLAFLRDTQPDALKTFRTIYLLDVPRLGQLAQQNIEEYVTNGGGVAVFLGPNSQLNFYRKWSEPVGDQAGFFPMPTSKADVLPPSTDGAPDLVATDHPIFKVLLGDANVFAAAIRFEGYVAPPDGWQPSQDSTVHVIATLRNGKPLAVERVVGDGRIIAFLSTLAPQWNSWATQPTFPVMLLETQAYLDSDRAPSASHRVGSPLSVQLEAARYQPQVEFLVPSGRPDQPRRVMLTATRSGDDSSPLMVVRLGTETSTIGTGVSGIYSVWPRTLDGELTIRRYVLNVDPSEGDLAIRTNEELAESLSGTDVELFSADELSLSEDDAGGFSWSQFLLVTLLALLVGEQLLAYLASYHPPVGVQP